MGKQTQDTGLAGRRASDSTTLDPSVDLVFVTQFIYTPTQMCVNVSLFWLAFCHDSAKNKAVLQSVFGHLFCPSLQVN